MCVCVHTVVCFPVLRGWMKIKHRGKYLSTLFSFCVCAAIIPSLTLIIRLKHCISICEKKCRCLNKQCGGRNLFESLQHDVYTKNEIPSR